MTQDRFVALDSWRGLCATGVALLHFTVVSFLHDLNLIQNGALFVDFFFVLSGFVIACNYQARLLSGFGVQRFLLLRFGRTYPLHVTILVLFVATEGLHLVADLVRTPNAVNAFTGGRDPLTILYDVLLIQNYGIVSSSWNVPAWSIAIEAVAYVAFAVVAVLSGRWFLAIASVFAVVFVAAIFDPELLAWRRAFRGLGGFFMGVIIYAVYSAIEARVATMTYRSMIFSAAEAIAIGLMVAYMSMAPGAIEYGYAPIVFAFLVLVFAFEGGLVSRFLRMRVFTYLGEISYSIYMVHFLLVGVVFHVSDAIGFSGMADLRTDVPNTAATTVWTQMFGLVATIAYFGTVVAVSTATYGLIERPARIWFRMRAARL